ncbi:MAG: alpha-hydroxy acid oxidase, partial [Thermomicrobiales bacterium]
PHMRRGIGVDAAKGLDTIVNVSEFESYARASMAKPTFDFIAGGAEDEVTLRANREAFSRLRLAPRILSGVETPRLATTVLGQPVSMPVLVAPMGLHQLAHPEGECASASAARQAGTVFSLGVAASVAMEAVAGRAGPWWFQTYLLRDRGLSFDLIRRAEAAGAGAIVLTVDVAVRGRRESDMRNRFEMPPGMTMPNLLPLDFRGDPPSYSKLTQWDPAITWKDLDWLAASTRLPVAVKGVLRADDARKAVGHGAAALCVSNHGGRQLDGAPAAIEALPAIAEAVGGSAEIILDGGVRRGSDVVKALALGARAVMVGRPILYGLAFAGEAGASAVLEMLRAELATAMILCGIGDVAEIARDAVTLAS